MVPLSTLSSPLVTYPGGVCGYVRGAEASLDLLANNMLEFGQHCPPPYRACHPTPYG